MKQVTGLSEQDERALELLRALGNPARLRIVSELAGRQACVTGDIIEVLPLAQSTVSQHLKVLKEAGVVRGTLEGDLCYCIDPDALLWLAQFCTGLATACCEPELIAPAGG